MREINNASMPSTVQYPLNLSVKPKNNGPSESVHEPFF